eukprot:3164204-Alexandrium_andersonii.AAC.1
MGAGAPRARLPTPTGRPRTTSPAGPAVGPSLRSSASQSARFAARSTTSCTPSTHCATSRSMPLGPS